MTRSSERSSLEIERISSTPGETSEMGRQLGSTLEIPSLVILEGDLGSGKTVFVQGLVEAFDIDPAEVSSPTFTLVNIYEGRTRIYHLDLYRIPEDVAIADQLGLAEMLTEKALVVIEWGERLRPEWRRSGFQVSFKWLSPTDREIRIRRIQ